MNETSNNTGNYFMDSHWSRLNNIIKTKINHQPIKPNQLHINTYMLKFSCLSNLRNVLYVWLHFPPSIIHMLIIINQSVIGLYTYVLLFTGTLCILVAYIGKEFYCLHNIIMTRYQARCTE